MKRLIKQLWSEIFIRNSGIEQASRKNTIYLLVETRGIMAVFVKDRLLHTSHWKRPEVVLVELKG
jgi:hypothetical protein